MSTWSRVVERCSAAEWFFVFTTKFCCINVVSFPVVRWRSQLVSHVIVVSVILWKSGHKNQNPLCFHSLVSRPVTHAIQTSFRTGRTRGKYAARALGCQHWLLVPTARYLSVRTAKRMASHSPTLSQGKKCINDISIRVQHIANHLLWKQLWRDSGCTDSFALEYSDETERKTSHCNSKRDCRPGPHNRTQRRKTPLDDGWPESVEEHGLLLLVLRHYITRQYIQDLL